MGRFYIRFSPLLGLVWVSERVQGPATMYYLVQIIDRKAKVLMVSDTVDLLAREALSRVVKFNSYTAIPALYMWVLGSPWFYKYIVTDENGVPVPRCGDNIDTSAVLAAIGEHCGGIYMDFDDAWDPYR